VCEESPYIFPPSKVVAPQSNGSELEESIKVYPVDVFWGSWVLSIVLCDKVWYLDIRGHLPRVVFSTKTLLLNQELKPPPVPVTI